MDSTTRQHDDKITSESTSNWIFLIPCHADSNCESKNRNRFNLIDPSTRQSTTHTKKVGIGPPKRSWLIGFCVFFALVQVRFPIEAYDILALVSICAELIPKQHQKQTTHRVKNKHRNQPDFADSRCSISVA